MSTGRKYTIVSLGTGRVGMSSLILRFTYNSFMNPSDTTIEDSYMKVITVDGETCQLDVIDAGGQEELRALRNQYYKKGDGLIVAYSITDRRSFEDVTGVIDGILEIREVESAPIVLCGCKCDLEEKRVVSREEGQELADKRGLPFIETSAKDGTNVEEVFAMVAHAARDDDIAHTVSPDNEEDKKCVIQ